MDGVSWSKFNFFRTWLCYISNKRDSRMHQHGSKYFARRPPTPPPPPDPLDGVRRSKFFFFQNMDMLNLKLKRITNAATNKSRVEPTIFFIEKISFSLKFFSDHFYEQSFNKTVQGHKRESRMQQHGSKYFARRHPQYWGWGQ